jgi:hypothetical protein
LVCSDVSCLSRAVVRLSCFALERLAFVAFVADVDDFDTIGK